MRTDEKALEAGQGNEGTTETHYYEGTIPMTLLNRTARRTLRLPAAFRLNLEVGRRLRVAAAEKGFTRTTLQAATGDTWTNTQRAWFGLHPMTHTVLRAQVAMRADAASIWPTIPASWA
jgi:hypothetical protein